MENEVNAYDVKIYLVRGLFDNLKAVHSMDLES